jgi:hypothetical protein
MEFIAQNKSWWITLGEVKRAGVIDMGGSLTFNGDILTFEDKDSWTAALAEHGVDPKNVFDKLLTIENEMRRMPNQKMQNQMQRRR